MYEIIINLNYMIIIKNMNKIKGFTLIELIIAVILIGILSLVGVVTYRGYRQRAIETEAKMMLGKLHEAQQVYYVRNKEYLSGLSNQAVDTSLGVDFRKNKYFTSFTVESTDYYATNGGLPSVVPGSGEETSTSDHSFSIVTNSYKGTQFKIVGGNSSVPVIYKNNGSNWEALN